MKRPLSQEVAADYNPRLDVWFLYVCGNVVMTGGMLSVARRFANFSEAKKYAEQKGLIAPDKE